MVVSSRDQLPYALWRRPADSLLPLRETGPAPSERLLQTVWQHQRLRRDQLQTTDGRRLLILHPGFWNREAGPDFQDALLQMDDDPARQGAVEIDVTASGWRGHGHERNPLFAKVILHVIWEGNPRPGLTTLILKDFLDAPLEELATWINTEAGMALPEPLPGRCAAPLGGLAPSQVRTLLQQAGQIRLQGKARRLQARARQVGWDQALWEGLFRALGYKNNAWPMQRLAELKPAWPAEPCNLRQWQARLLGAGGLLPQQLHPHHTQAARYLRQLWDHWWREREFMQPHVLPPQAWRFDSVRPANHPCRRLALAAHWLCQQDLVRQLEQWGTSPQPSGPARKSLHALLQPAEDPFWSWHCSFQARPFSQPQPLLGAARLTDLAVNVLLPWLWSRAAEGRPGPLRDQLEQRYLEWPRGEDNAALKRARQRLLGTRALRSVRGAAGQQGLLQITRDFCAESNALCEGCLLPACLAQWAQDISA